MSVALQRLPCFRFLCPIRWPLLSAIGKPGRGVPVAAAASRGCRARAAGREGLVLGVEAARGQRRIRNGGAGVPPPEGPSAAKSRLCRLELGTQVSRCPSQCLRDVPRGLERTQNAQLSWGLRGDHSPGCHTAGRSPGTAVWLSLRRVPRLWEARAHASQSCVCCRGFREAVYPCLTLWCALRELLDRQPRPFFPKL